MSHNAKELTDQEIQTQIMSSGLHSMEDTVIKNVLWDNKLLI